MVLQNTNGNFKGSLDILLEACQVLSFEWRYLYLNQAAEKQNRRPNKELLGKTMLECWPGIEQSDVFAQLNRSMTERIALHQEIEFFFPDGSKGWFDVRSQAVPEGIFVLSIDITERVRHEKELARQYRLYAALSQINQAIVKINSAEELFPRVCQVLVEFAGMKMAWIGKLDQTTLQIIPIAQWGEKTEYLHDLKIVIQDQPEGNGPTAKAFRSGQSQICNDMLGDPSLEPWRQSIEQYGFRSSGAFPVFLNGVIAVLNVYSTEIQFFQEKEIALLEEAVNDVSFALENFSREAEKQKAETLANQEKVFSEAVMASMPGIIYFYTEEGKFLRWNQNFSDISGYSSAEIALMHPLDFFCAEDKEIAVRRIKEVFEQGESVLEARLLTKTGSLHPFFFTGRKILFDATPSLIGMGISITELKNAENEVRRLNANLEQRVKTRTAELEAANRELEAFSYSVSHDLRSPLRAITGFSEILLKKFSAELTPEALHYLERISKGGQRMGVLIDDLLSFSRLSRQSLNRRKIATKRMVQGVIEELKSSYEGRNVQIDLQDLPDCYGDPALVKQVWVNLISNAIKYSRQRNPAKIKITAENKNDGVCFIVSDNGSGFDMKYVGKLFGVFQRLHNLDQFEGTGVGLAIVKRIVERHGGQVWATAEENQGATFGFTLKEEDHDS